MIIVIHGTGAAGQSWWKSNSLFTNYLDQISNGDLYKGPNPFSWTGIDQQDHREAGADDLVLWVQSNHSTYLTIVAHSHGGNVAMMATRRGLEVDRLILLGTPIRTDCTPDIRRIGLLYNVYSFGDTIQKLGGKPHTRGEGRSLGDSDKTINFLAHNGGVLRPGPGHSDLYEVSVWQANDFDQFLL